MLNTCNDVNAKNNLIDYCSLWIKHGPATLERLVQKN